MKRILIGAVIGGLLYWPGMPLVQFYGPFLMAWAVGDSGRPPFFIAPEPRR